MELELDVMAENPPCVFLLRAVGRSVCMWGWGRGRDGTSTHQHVLAVDWANVPDPWGKVSDQMSYHLRVNTNNNKETLFLKIWISFDQGSAIYGPESGLP